MAQPDPKLLSTLLNDHLALATAAAELVKRMAASNQDSELGALLRVSADQTAAEREALLHAMDVLGVRRDRVKESAAWAGEKLGRLKPNGRIVGYSPVSRVVELEALTLLSHAMAGLWAGLDRALGDDERLVALGLAGLAETARRRAEALDPQRVDAIVAALRA